MGRFNRRRKISPQWKYLKTASLQKNKRIVAGKLLKTEENKIFDAEKL